MIALCLILASSPAAADIVFDDAAQSTFGFDASGAPSGGEADPEFAEAWEAFRYTRIGAEILSRLDRGTDATITLRVATNDEIAANRHTHDDDHGGHDRVHGLAQRMLGDDGEIEYVVWLASDATGGVDELAETIFHELRHVEVWVNGESNEIHLPIDAGYDAALLTFRSQLEAGPHPIYDSIIASQAGDPVEEQILFILGDTLEDIVDFDLAAPPTLAAPQIDLEETIMIDGIDAELADELNDLLGDARPVGDGRPCADTGAAHVCGLDHEHAVQPGDVLVGMRFADAIPQPGTVFDANLNVFVAVESDGDEANDVPPLEAPTNNPFVGADRWYRMYRSSETDGFEFFAQGVEGDSSDLSLPSDGFAIVEGDTVLFTIPRPDLPGDFPRVRPGAIGYQGDIQTGPRGLDVLGELGSDPLIGVDGSRVTGPVTGFGETRDSLIFSFGPTIVPSGGKLHVAACLYGKDGSPLTGHDGAITLGQPPEGPNATHAEIVTDDIGCFDHPLDVREPPGETMLWLFDGTEVTDVETIILIEPAVFDDSAD